MMKKINTLLFLLLLITILPLVVNAEEVISTNDYIVNQNNVMISTSDYENLSRVYSDAYLMVMTQDNYDYLKTKDFSNVVSQTKYIETTYNNSLGIVTSRELTEAEYNNVDVSNVSTMGYDYIETTYKKITLYVTKGTMAADCTITCVWKGIPSTRSFDVIGIRFQNYNVSHGTQTGQQIYKKSGSSDYSSVVYSATGTNINRQDNGYGISMNIVNDSITYLELTTNTSAVMGTGTIAVYASYQHATDSLTLAQSKNYTLGAAGLGNVFIYPYSISQHYDGTGGVQVLG